MNADLLLKHFERISDAPDALPRLRRFILNLAVRGRLAEQDENEEPAHKLMERLTSEHTCGKRAEAAQATPKRRVRDMKVRNRSSPFFVA